MLSLLHIEDIALIERADIAFGPGFNVLTGETGAGKSIVVDAIGAVMGERTSRDLIRTGAGSALVTALFRDLPDLPWFAQMGVGPDENGELLISRRLRGDGRNLCRVGDVPCTVVQLKELGAQLIDIHGQHDGQQLLDESCHLGYLDSFGGLEAQRADYAAAFEALAAVRREIVSLKMDEAEKARRIDTLSFQIAELERAAPVPGEEEELEERRTILRSADRLLTAVEGAYGALFGGEDREGAVDLLAEASQEVARVRDLSKDLGELAEVLESLRCAADDAAERLRQTRDGMDFSPRALDEVESRLDLLHRLKKKYGPTTEDMLAHLDRCRAELERIGSSEEALAALRQRRGVLLTAAREKAAALSAARQAAAGRLKERIETELRQLDMPRVRFETQFGPKPGKLGLDETGADEVCFLMSANVGESLRPIAKVASGGELSRIMLALKNVLAENDSIRTLIFDEVDAGVSGRAAGKVAEKMSRLAHTCQVLCVTHLPQIAAMADSHFSVQKEERDGRTYTSIRDLDRTGRVEELARLTGGAHRSAAILEGAEELLRQAEGYRQNEEERP